MAQDRRDSFRFEVEGGQVRVVHPQIGDGLSVCDLSASGGGFVMPAAWVEGLQGTRLTFQLGAHPAFGARVELARSLPEGEDARRVGVRFSDLDPGGLGTLSEYLTEQQLDKNQRRPLLFSDWMPCMAMSTWDAIHKVLRYYAIGWGVPIQVRGGSLFLPLTLRATDITVEAGRRLIVVEALSGSTDSLEAGREYDLSFAGANAVNVFSATVWRREGGQVWLCLPDVIRRVGFRDSFRFRVQPENNIYIRLAHRRLGGRQLRKRALDIGGRGLSFMFEPRTDVLFPGERIGALTLEMEDQHSVANAVIRNIYRFGSDKFACGIELLGFLDESHARNWNRYVFQAGHPGVVLGARKHVRQAWEVLTSSGYLKEASPRVAAHARQRYIDTWERHSEQSDISSLLLLRDGGRTVGTVAANLLYPRTWIIHHLGIDEQVRTKDKKKLFSLARKAYCGMQHLMYHVHPLDHFIIFADAQKTWNELLFERFLRQHSEKSDFMFDKYSVYRGVPSRLTFPVSPLAPQWRFVQARQAVLAELSRLLMSRRPLLECEAYAYSPDVIDLQDFCAACSARGYERCREIFCAIHKDELVAALFAETGDEGVNVFGLLNRCWLVVLDEKYERDLLIESRLLRQVTGFYADRKKSEFVYMRDRLQCDDQLKSGFEYAADGFRFLARRKLIPAWMSHVDEMMRLLSD